MAVTQAADGQSIPSFAQRIIDWQASAGRHDLPWQVPDPYRVWLSEVMLQQTQVQTVLGYFQRFITAFPTVADLARADEDQVLHLWAGLGYYARARRLHACAKDVVERFEGRFPCDLDDLISLPGIGRSTAGAIRSLAFGLPAAILDGNVKRVLARHAAIVGVPEVTAVARQLWAAADQRVQDVIREQAEALAATICVKDVSVRYQSASQLGQATTHSALQTWSPARAYTQGMMDLGATLCTPRQPQCSRCPVAHDCVARSQGIVEQLPTPKPTKRQPLRHCALILVQRADGAVLLQRRPSTGGIWSGLWCLPQVDRDGQAEALQTLWEGFVELLKDETGEGGAADGPLDRMADLHLDALRIGHDGLSRGAVIRHVFSHFKLDMTPVWVRVSNQQLAQLDAITTLAESQRWVWVSGGSLSAYGLPAPVQKLLQRTLAQQDGTQPRLI